MFSQLRNAVEQLAQQPIRVLEGSSPENQTEPASRSASLDMQATRSTSPLSSSQLAESALLSLRKSLASQRSGSSTQPTKTPATSPPPPEPHASPRKSNLEERLRRATFAIGDASGSSTPQRSSRVASPSPMGRGRVPRVEESPASSVRRTASPAPSVRRDSSPALSVRRDASPAPSVRRTASPAPSVRRDASPAPSVRRPASRTASPASIRRTASITRTPATESKMKPTELVSKEKEKVSTKVQPKEEQARSAPLIESPPIAQATPPTEVQSAEEVKEDSVKALESTTPEEAPLHPSEEPANETDSTREPSSEDALTPEEEKALELSTTDKLVPQPLEEPAKEIELAIETPSEGSAVSEAANILEVATAEEPVPQLFEELAKETESTIEAPSEDTLEPKASPTAPKSLTTVEVPSSEKTSAEEASSTIESPSEDTLAPEAAPPAPGAPAIVEVASEKIADPQPVTPTILESEPQPKEKHAEPEAPPIPVVDHSAEVESLQTRLKQVEQRFSDVSTSFKRLQAEKLAADAILREVTPLESIKDADALREFFTNLRTKDEVFQEELKRLNQKLELQEDRLEEVRDTHKLESHSLSEEVKKLRNQLNETEALFQAAQRATSHAEQAADKQKEQFAQLQKEVETAKNIAKEEEEKRVKAISLLKTVRQKLVKAEKDKDDAMRELLVVKEREKDDKSKEQAERINFQQEMESLNGSHEKAVANLKAQFNKDFANMKERYEQETAALRGQFELDIAATKNTHTKELGAKSSQITTLENSLNNVTRDKNAFFDQLQLRQAEVESAQAHLESLQHQNTEFQFQLREANDRLALLKEEYSELLREQDSRSRDPAPSADEIARMVSATEAKYETKLAEMKRNVAILEKERYEAEADWSRKLKEKVKDLEDLKRVLGSATRSREADESIVAELKAELEHTQETAKILERQVSELPLLREQIRELQRSSKEQEQETSVKILVLEKQVEESKARELQLKQSSKTLREELRKVQSSAALLERQRNPGVGYWTTRVGDATGNGPASADPRVSMSSPSSEPLSRVSSPTPSTATSTKNEEEVNLEYLRNVILQFLEHKEMRPNLVKVLSIILHFTPQETRRLIAKV